jgi:hypothetical protein
VTAQEWAFVLLLLLLAIGLLRLAEGRVASQRAYRDEVLAGVEDRLGLLAAWEHAVRVGWWAEADGLRARMAEEHLAEMREQFRRGGATRAERERWEEDLTALL